MVCTENVFFFFPPGEASQPVMWSECDYWWGCLINCLQNCCMFQFNNIQVLSANEWTMNINERFGSDFFKLLPTGTNACRASHCWLERMATIARKYCLWKLTNIINNNNNMHIQFCLSFIDREKKLLYSVTCFLFLSDPQNHTAAFLVRIRLGIQLWIYESTKINHSHNQTVSEWIYMFYLLLYNIFYYSKSNLGGTSQLLQITLIKQSR